MTPVVSRLFDLQSSNSVCTLPMRGKCALACFCDPIIFDLEAVTLPSCNHSKHRKTLCRYSGHYTISTLVVDELGNTKVAFQKIARILGPGRSVVRTYLIQYIIVEFPALFSYFEVHKGNTKYGAKAGSCRLSIWLGVKRLRGVPLKR